MFFLLKEENFLIFLKTNQLFRLILVTNKGFEASYFKLCT
jgi:hypothetical protein